MMGVNYGGRFIQARARLAQVMLIRTLLRQRRFGPALFERQPGYFFFLYAIILVQALILIVAALQTVVPVERLFRDIFSIAKYDENCCEVYDGLISHLGILLWWTAASITGFTAMAAAMFCGRADEIKALIMATIFTVILALDDMFMLHESVLPFLGAPELATYALYAVLAGIYITLSWRLLLSASPIFLMIALSMFSMSIFTDILSEAGWGSVSLWLQNNKPVEFFIEDGFKFLGIGFWCCLHIAAAMRVISTLTPSTPSGKA